MPVKLTPAQTHKLLILFLMLVAKSGNDKDFDKSTNPATPGAPTYHDAIQNLIADVPGAITILDQWLAGSNPNDRTNAKTAAGDYLNMIGNPWGGSGNCPLDIATMTGWLNNV
jgi:hypothetical protein